MTIEIENKNGFILGKSKSITPDMAEMLAPILSKMAGIQNKRMIQITGLG
jgi:hypothetical protein